VRGGCEPWQLSRCAIQRYTALDDHGNPKGWLLQAWRAVNRTWPHADNRLVNSGLMATGPEGFARCTNAYVPDDADAVLLAFADICEPDGESAHATLTNSSFGVALEAIVRTLLARPWPPSIVLFNTFPWMSSSCAPCAYTQMCDGALSELASYYHLSVVSMRGPLFRAAFQREGPFFYPKWTTDDGRHLDLGLGDRLAAELLFHWARRAASTEAPPAAGTLTGGWLADGDPLSDLRPRPTRAEALAMPAACYSFDETFGGRVSQPHVLSTLSHGWHWVELAPNGKRKPGYVTTEVGARLVIDSLASVTHRVALGYLRTYSSTAVTRVVCVLPCRCASLDLSAAAPGGQRTSTTAFSEPLAVRVPRARLHSSCHLELRLVTNGSFKFISLQVFT